MATLAFELVEQLGTAPGTLILPVGQGTLLLGAFLAFQSLLRLGHIGKLPRLIGVQVRACAPLWAVRQAGLAGLAWVSEGPTLAEGIRIAHPIRGNAVLAAVEQSAGDLEVVEESEIGAGQPSLARRGFYVEPTSAVVWPVLLRRLSDLPDPVVVALTGSGFKTD
jgi:threonine synthase